MDKINRHNEIDEKIINKIDDFKQSILNEGMVDNLDNIYYLIRKCKCGEIHIVFNIENEIYIQGKLED